MTLTAAKERRRSEPPWLRVRGLWTAGWTEIGSNRVGEIVARTTGNKEGARTAENRICLCKNTMFDKQCTVSYF